MTDPAAGLTWSLSIRTEERDGVHVVLPRGRLGTLSSGDLIETMVTAIRAGRRRIVLDLSGVDYISSAGLLALDAVLGRVHTAAGELVLCGLHEPVRLAFELSGLLPHFAIENACVDAVARAKRRP